MTARRPRLRRLAAAIAAAGATLALSVGLAPAAAAAATEGWARVAHLSPDTKGVDVRLAAVAGGEVLYTLTGVSYGQVSDYLPLATGSYVVSMVPTGMPATTPPVISRAITVSADQPITVAAYGTNADLRTAVYTDDLTPPAAGQARVRVIQASTTADQVDVSTTSGTPIVRGAGTGAATGYTSVPGGAWTLELGGDASGRTEIDLAAGSVSSLLVLDTAAGSQTVKAVTDAAAPGQAPVGGVQTGGGGMAGARDGAGATPAVLGALAGLAALAALGLVRPRGGRARHALVRDGRGR